MDIIKLWNEKNDISIENFVVDWEPRDHVKNPMNWNLSKRFSCTLLLSCIAFLVTMASSIGSGTYDGIISEFGATKEVAELTTSLFLIGFATGAPILAPLSEEIGRLPIYIISLLIFSCFQVGAGSAKSMSALAICRFFSGFFGTTPLSNAGGSIADMWKSDERTFMFPLFGVFGFLGPALGPIIGSYLSKSYLTWRWSNYLVAILGFALSIVVFLFMPETFDPVIMDIKASRIRNITGNKEYISVHEIQRQGNSPFSLKMLVRPFIFAISQPIVICFTICITVTYIVLFSDFESFPSIFATWNFDTAKSTLPFIAVAIGILFTLFLVTPLTYFHYMKEVKKYGSCSVVAPEIRLIPLMVCCWFIPISLFWIAWTSYDNISPWLSIISTFFFGIGMMQVFITTYSYIIDSYGINSASALSTLTLVRYNVSAVMVHVTDPMYKDLGRHWAASLLGFLSLFICGCTFFFWFFGPRMRRLSKFTVQISDEELKLSNSKETIVL